MIARERSLVLMSIIVLVLGTVLGGGPTSSYISMIVELPACLLAAMALAGLVDGACPRRSYAAIFLLALACAVPMVQLVPLPVGIWTALPGREIPEAISRIAGFSGQWRPLSLNPELTRLAALCMIVPSATFLATLQFGLRGRDRMMIAIVALAALSALIGVFQVASGGGLSLGIYRQIHVGYPIGLFANRNHEADLLLVAIPFSARLVSLRPMAPNHKLPLLAMAVIFFTLSVVATQSRTGLALLPIAWGGAMVVWIDDLRDRRILIGAGCFLVVVVVAYLAIRLTPMGHRVLLRFDDVGVDSRPQIWLGTWSAIQAFWPAGSGVGCFVPVYQMFEDLNLIAVEWVNHAHNDYLELILDAGIAAAVLLVGYAVLLLWVLSLPVPPVMRGQRYAAASAIVILLGHSLTDYPLRTFGLLVVFAFCNAVLFIPRDAYRIRRSKTHPVSPQTDFAFDVGRQ